MELCIWVLEASVFQNSSSFFSKHSNNIGLRENSHIFVPSSFSHLKSDVQFFDLHIFQTILYNLLISAHAHLFHDTDYARKACLSF